MSIENRCQTFNENAHRYLERINGLDIPKAEKDKLYELYLEVSNREDEIYGYSEKMETNLGRYRKALESIDNGIRAHKMCLTIIGESMDTIQEGLQVLEERRGRDLGQN